MKKLLLLGGSRYLLPVIREAKELGLYTITCDYLPDNIAHRYSDAYHNVSITDLEATKKLAGDLGVDGVMSFACDPGVVTAAYVAEELGLPNVGPYESVCILQDKARFRGFLREHGFRVPGVRSYDSMEAALKEKDSLPWPQMVKPVDCAGSKGVSRVNGPDELEQAIRDALHHSRCGRFLLEDYIEKKGFSSDTDCFSVDGELRYVSFNNQYFDPQADNPYAPIGYTWPSTIPQAQQDELAGEIQRLLHLLKMKTALYNIEVRLIRNAVKAAVGLPVEEMHNPVYSGHWSIVMLHAQRDGVFRGLEIAPDARASVVEEDLWVEPGDPVEAMTGANKAIGSLVMNWPSEEERDARMQNPSAWLRILTEESENA